MRNRGIGALLRGLKIPVFHRQRLGRIARGWMRARSGGELHRDDVGSSASAPT